MKSIERFAVLALALLALPLFAGIATPASAQTMRDLKTCQDTAGDVDEVIEACSVFIRTRRAVDGRRAPAAALSAIYYLRGYAYSRKYETKRAIDDYTQALDISSANLGVHVVRANAYIAIGDMPRAYADFDAVISRSKNKGILADAYANRGQAYFNDNEFAKAVADFTQALNNEPNRTAAYLARAQAYAYLGDSARANADYKEAQRLVPSSREMVEDNRTLEVRWIEYLKEIQDENDYGNWNGPPLDKLRGANTSVAALPSGGAGSCNDATVHWQSVESIKTRGAYEDHLARFPNCAFASLATARIAALGKDTAKTCPAGQAQDSDGDCVKQRKPPAREAARQRPQRAAPRGESAPPSLDCATPAGLFACANHALSRSPLAVGQ
jgi:tetratricopeptide (TPR) repeat protein